VRRQVRSALGRPVHPVSAAPSHAQAEAALVTLHRPPWGAVLAKSLNAQCDHLLDYYQGVARTAPEGCWRDFRLRLGHGRHPGSEQRWERAALVWAIHHNFEPARWRCERRRHYTCTARKCRCRHPGQSALPVAGVPPGERSYLDALGVQTPTEPLLIVPTRHRAAGGEAWAQADRLSPTNSPHGAPTQDGAESAETQNERHRQPVVYWTRSGRAADSDQVNSHDRI
jgi:hypothetical protein